MRLKLTVYEISLGVLNTGISHTYSGERKNKNMNGNIIRNILGDGTRVVVVVDVILEPILGQSESTFPCSP